MPVPPRHKEAADCRNHDIGGNGGVHVRQRLSLLIVDEDLDHSRFFHRHTIRRAVLREVDPWKDVHPLAHHRHELLLLLWSHALEETHSYFRWRVRLEEGRHPSVREDE